MKTRCFIVATFALLSVTAYSQSVGSNWKKELKENLEKFLSCTTEGDKSSCSRYIGESLKTVYGIDDFFSRSAGRYMTASEINAYLGKSGSWSSLGQSYDQQVLTQAAEHANRMKAVVAVFHSATGDAHVALITPGELISSGSWGLKVPLAASFSPVEPSKSFTDKGLSFAFTKQMMKDVTIYAHR